MATPKKEKPKDIEVEPDAWERFTKTVDKAAPVKRPKPKKEKP
tara:strand:- start:2178 stop:2306 length:129 start_codon:yes stop_codon:yes gene_type:complete